MSEPSLSRRQFIVSTAAVARGASFDPARPPLDFWVFAGQSNSHGWGLLKAPVPVDPRILLFNTKNEWVTLEEPINSDFERWTPGPFDRSVLLQRDGVQVPRDFNVGKFVREQKTTGRILGGVGPAGFFARHLVRHINHRIGLISCGVGSPIRRWDPDRRNDSNSLYGAMMKRIEKAGHPVKAMVWYQGESDALTIGAADNYESAFLAVVDGIRKDTGQPDLPIIYVQVGRYVTPYVTHAQNWERIREIQRRAMSLRKNLFMTSSIDLSLEDPIHLSFEAYQRLGPRLAELALSGVYGLPGHGRPIEFQSAELVDSESRRILVRVRFKGVNGRLRASGRPSGFALRMALPERDPHAGYPKPASSDDPVFVVYRVDFDPQDPTALILGIFDLSPIMLGKPHPLTATLKLIYGPGTDPHANIVDEKDMPIPAFGPVDVKV